MFRQESLEPEHQRQGRLRHRLRVRHLRQLHHGHHHHDRLQPQPVAQPQHRPPRVGVQQHPQGVLLLHYLHGRRLRVRPLPQPAVAQPQHRPLAVGVQHPQRVGLLHYLHDRRLRVRPLPQPAARDATIRSTVDRDRHWWTNSTHRIGPYLRRRSHSPLWL